MMITIIVITMREMVLGIESKPLRGGNDYIIMIL